MPGDFTISQYRDEIFPLTHQDTLDVESMVRPTVQIPAHLAPMAIYFHTHDHFPPQYKNTAFVALRGGLQAVNKPKSSPFSAPQTATGPE